MCYMFIHMHCGCMMYGWWLFSYSETGKASHQPNIDYHSFLLPDGLRLSLSTLLESSALDLVSCGHNLLPWNSIGNTMLWCVQVSALCQAVYVGCETCSKPLEQVGKVVLLSVLLKIFDMQHLCCWQDENGVYCQCASCMTKKPGGWYRSMLVGWGRKWSSRAHKDFLRYPQISGLSFFLHAAYPSSSYYFRYVYISTLQVVYQGRPSLTLLFLQATGNSPPR